AEDRAAAVREIILRGGAAGAAGQSLRVGDVAEVTAGFADTDQMARLNGQRAVSLTAYKSGRQDAIEIAELVKAYTAGRRGEPLELTFGERAALLAARMRTGEPVAAPVSERLRAHELGRMR